MTSRELIAAEAANTDRIALYREGLFWKAYERSAYALCTQVRPFKPTRKVLKTLAGGDIVSVGFPAHAADRILAGLVRLDAADAAGAGSAARVAPDAAAASVDPAACAAGASDEPHTPSAARMVFAAPRRIDEEGFRAWKSAQPVSIAIPRPSAAETAADRAASADSPLVDASREAMRPVSTFAVSAVLADAAGYAAASAGDVPASAEPSSPGRPLYGVKVFRPRWWTRLGRWFARSGAPLGSSRAVSAAAGIAETGVADSSAGVDMAARRCLDALRKFEVADKTPMECMMFIAELKKRFLKI